MDAPEVREIGDAAPDRRERVDEERRLGGARRRFAEGEGGRLGEGEEVEDAAPELLARDANAFCGRERTAVDEEVGLRHAPPGGRGGHVVERRGVDEPELVGDRAEAGDGR